MRELSGGLSGRCQSFELCQPPCCPPQFEVRCSELRIALFELCRRLVHALSQDSALPFSLRRHLVQLPQHSIECLCQQTQFIGSPFRNLQVKLTRSGSFDHRQQMLEGTINHVPKQNERRQRDQADCQERQPDRCPGSSL